MQSLNSFIIQKPRPLPVVIGIDRSGSMDADGKIEALNIALINFIESLKQEDASKAEIHLALFSFGGESAICDIPLQPIQQVSILQFTASGKTPMGSAFLQMKALIEDKDQIPSRAYKPTIVLLTDGLPTDDWQSAMYALIQEGRSSKAFRIAMAIGDDADKAMLAQFASEPEYLISGENARDIRKFFRFVTMSVTQRMKSQSPDQPQTPEMPDDDTLDF